MTGTVRRLLLPALLLAATQMQAQAQGWPDRPIKFISSQAAGSGTDVVGRLVADRLSARRRPGAAPRRPADRVREPPRRWQCDRHPGGGAFGAGRLHLLLCERSGAG